MAPEDVTLGDTASADAPDPADGPATPDSPDAAGEVALEVADLHVEVAVGRERHEVVRDVSLTLRRGRMLGLVGESGSGKSMTAYAISGLLPRAARVAGGTVVMDGVDLTNLGRRRLADLRGRRIGMIFQEPRRSLNPAFTVGDQIAESVRRHLGVGKRTARQRAVELLERVRVPHPDRRVDDYPHAFSGGMCQRVMLAMALACRPRVLIADEPTTALDVTVQASVLDLLAELQDEMGLAVLLITHDLGVVAEMCDDVAVMYAGRIVERASVRPLFHAPRHPYTEGLLRSIPHTLEPMARFASIPGSVPALDAMPSGCRFHPRCEHAVDGVCTATEPTLAHGDDHQDGDHGDGADGDGDHGVACHRADEIALQGVRRG